MNTPFSVLLIQALHVLLVLADPCNITVVETGAHGGAVQYRVWYGDVLMCKGQAYIGTNVPDTIEQAVNITSPGTINEILYIEATSATATTADLSSYFMAINTSPTASDPIYFTDSLSSLSSLLPEADADTDTDTTTLVSHWVAYSGYLLPVTDSGSLLSTTLGGGVYIVPVSGVDGTYSVRWIMDASVAAGLGGAKVLLSSLPVLAVAASS
ncbi:hypothetical protein VMCG_09632 [Cytospora schulzeri]|uniref:Uncharacterized protein n=1 Tax=Cytospora schulzeri TaxID=448051 RepID=A0A423VEU2_9PEZI|nr:hypothetical protein VMCG_09632 [Valsa malicola]